MSYEGLPWGTLMQFDIIFLKQELQMIYDVCEFARNVPQLLCKNKRVVIMLGERLIHY